MAENNRYSFFERCIKGINGSVDGMFIDLWEKAGDIAEFAEMLVSSDDDNIKMTQAYAVASKLVKGHWQRVRAMMGDDCRKTYSDAGGLKIGNSMFSVIIPNNYGDGVTRYAVLEREDFNGDMMNFYTSCEGTINIYKHDCGCEIDKTISGRYGIYVYDGLIVFEKWGD